MERDIFISYSRWNLEKVKVIKAELEKSTGVECWMDLNAIESGSMQFTQDIIDGINSSNVFLFMLSNESQKSEFALRELQFAMKKAKKDNRKHVIIVNIDDCQMCDEFDFMYGLTDTIAWMNQPQREKLLRDIMRWTGKAKQEYVTTKEDSAKRQYKTCFKMAAGTNVGLVPNSNDDNFVVSPDVSSHNWLIPQNDNYVDLGDLGALLVVVDGENNAGDVASAIACEIVQRTFATETLKWIVNDSGNIQRFMVDVLRTADLNIYNRSQTDKDKSGMCASIAMAYVIGTKVYVCWCGNCRCYVSNKHSGLSLLSNRTTPCLGIIDKRAQPECRICDLQDDDYILLCSDGLFNLVRDEEIHSIFNKYQDSAMECKNELISAALANGGNDNVTVALMKVKIKEI